ncbi:hypothetical protein N665_0658s0013 [Sinapis alba]|nr:hypothetical protein N665_0658s0013 [Sinapis alba]
MATIPTAATATMCPSPPLPTISPLLRTSHHCQPSPSSSSPSSIKLGTTLFYSEAMVDESSLEKRRKKRRRRRAGLDPEEEENLEAHVGASRSVFLSRLEEVQLCLYFKEGTKLENIGASAEENEMKKRSSANEIICRRREAREKITHCYQRLVVSISTGYQGKGLNLQDLIQEGSIGLLRCAERFDPELRSLWELKAKVAEASNVLSRKLRRIPSCKEIAEQLNIHAASHNGRMTLQEIVRGPDETRPEEMVRKEHMKHEIKQLLGTLTARESRVLGLYSGLNVETPRERVRQINGIALTKLQNVHNVNNDLKLYNSPSE